jgi:hypothetical protein
MGRRTAKLELSCLWRRHAKPANLDEIFHYIQNLYDLMHNMTS